MYLLISITKLCWETSKSLFQLQWAEPVFQKNKKKKKRRNSFRKEEKESK